MDARIIKGRQEHLGWRELFQDSPQAHLGIPNSRDCRALLTLVHISDTHICDAQSPARVEFLDRFADPHHPLSQKIGGLVGTYRAQEILTVQVLDSLIRKINRIEHAPILGMPIQTVLVTGDVTDNAQSNELDWFLALMNGGFVTPDSGNRSRWEGVGGDHYSPHYWNPHGTPTGELDDYP
ncbi:MAG: TIGR03767 family metallophosphoesterase, partial [Actinobacteria bacterium]|nr:TIGR03767 family metallophosphoesterase [Actinomycetota bacterium]